MISATAPVRRLSGTYRRRYSLTDPRTLFTQSDLQTEALIESRDQYPAVTPIPVARYLILLAFAGASPVKIYSFGSAINL